MKASLQTHQPAVQGNEHILSSNQLTPTSPSPQNKASRKQALAVALKEQGFAGLVNRQDLCKALKISDTTLDRLIASGHFKGNAMHGAGRRRRFEVAEAAYRYLYPNG
jgi:hypothetical protein